MPIAVYAPSFFLAIFVFPTQSVPEITSEYISKLLCEAQIKFTFQRIGRFFMSPTVGLKQETSFISSKNVPVKKNHVLFIAINLKKKISLPDDPLFYGRIVKIVIVDCRHEQKPDGEYWKFSVSRKYISKYTSLSKYTYPSPEKYSLKYTALSKEKQISNILLW